MIVYYAIIILHIISRALGSYPVVDLALVFDRGNTPGQRRSRCSRESDAVSLAPPLMDIVESLLICGPSEGGDLWEDNACGRGNC